MPILTMGMFGLIVWVRMHQGRLRLRGDWVGVVGLVGTVALERLSGVGGGDGVGGHVMEGE